MKDIGSIFPLTTNDIEDKSEVVTVPKNSKRIDFSLCREALYAIAKKYDYTNKRVLIPAYTCQTVIDPFIQQGWDCHYYNIDLQLRIDLEHLVKLTDKIQPTIVVVHPYYGIELNQDELDTLYKIREKGIVLVKDITQSIYSHIDTEHFDYVTGSYRKWINVPDGGFLESLHLDGIQLPEIEHTSFVKKQIDAMYLRNLYFETHDETVKQISIRLNKDAVSDISKNISLHKISEFSLWKLFKENKSKNINIRLENYSYLYNHVRNTDWICKVSPSLDVITTAPLYFPIYVKNRKELQKILASHHIYAPVLWPVNTSEVLINDVVKEIYDTILMIPIDQRYDNSDMSKVAKLINSYGK